MARIDLARRAQIGQDRRARTRAQLIEAARALYGRNPIEAVTVDDVVGGAAVAKGTFYVHFAGLDELRAAVANELAQEFDELLQPRRLATDDPIERIAAGCGAFVGEALRNPAWGALVARGAVSMPNVALKRAGPPHRRPPARRSERTARRLDAGTRLRIRHRRRPAGNAGRCGEANRSLASAERHRGDPARDRGEAGRGEDHRDARRPIRPARARRAVVGRRLTRAQLEGT
jgi:AcrR family transcriptional regulator